MNDAEQTTEPLYGPATEAAVANFVVSGEPVDARVIRALAQVKAAAASANAELLGEPFDGPVGTAIVAAAESVADGQYGDAFPVDVFQTGSGTSTNMNVNEVIASLATQACGIEVHPNDHVNASQSTNDTFPTALRIATIEAIGDALAPPLELLERELALVGRKTASIAKAGRTHLMDASPIMVGHEFAGHRSQIRDARDRILRSVDSLAAVPLGGTATGNGLNTPAGYAELAIARLAERTGHPLREVRDHFAAQGSQDDLVEASAQLRGAAIAMFKVANDIRWSASGPNTGLGEYHLAELQPGSSIMPGKVNPVACEVVLQVCAQVIGNDAAVAFAGTQGNHQLNAFLPVIGRNLLASVDLLAGAAVTLAKAVRTLEVDLARCRDHAERSPAVAAALNTSLGYDTATKVVREARRRGQTVREQAVASGLLSEQDADEILDVAALARGMTTPFLDDVPGEDPDVPPAALPPGETGSIGPDAPPQGRERA